MRKIKILVAIIIVITIIIWNNEIFKSRQEISSLELVKMAGMDYEFKEVDNGVKNKDLDNEDTDNNNDNEQNSNNENPVMSKVSIMIDNSSSKSVSSGGTGDIATESKKEVFSFVAPSFNTAVANMQLYTEKAVAGSHIQFFLLGNETVNYNVMKAIDFVARNNEIRLNARIYAIKDMSAQEFLSKMIKEEYSIEDKLSKLEEESEFLKKRDASLEIIDVLKANMEKDTTYIIPTLRIQGQDEEVTNIKVNQEGEPEKKNTSFSFDGYTVIHENKKLLYLDLDQAEIYNLLINDMKGFTIDVIKGRNVISFGLLEANTNYSFKFDKKDKLKKIIVDIKMKTNFEEDDIKEKIFTEAKIEEYEKEQEKIIKEKVTELFKLSAENKVDFMKIGDELNLKHPYKFRKMRDNWEEIISNVEIETKVDCMIRRSYDVIITQ